MEFLNGDKIRFVIDGVIGWETKPPTSKLKLVIGDVYTSNGSGSDGLHVSLQEDPTYPECYEFHPDHFELVKDGTTTN